MIAKEQGNKKNRYVITDKCRGCRICYGRCPQRCIESGNRPFVIDQKCCIRCGLCQSVCPFQAVIEQ